MACLPHDAYRRYVPTRCQESPFQKTRRQALIRVGIRWHRFAKIALFLLLALFSFLVVFGEMFLFRFFAVGREFASIVHFARVAAIASEAVIRPKVLKLSAFRLRQLELKFNFNNIEGD